MNNRQAGDREKTPEELLAEDIILELIENGLVRQEKQDEFVDKLAEDQITIKDWGTEIEKSTEGENCDDDQN